MKKLRLSVAMLTLFGVGMREGAEVGHDVAHALDALFNVPENFLVLAALFRRE